MLNSTRQTPTRVAVLVLICALALSTTAGADDNLLGKIDFPNSGPPEAQADFIIGVLNMHNFEYEEANAAFARAREIAPDFAMAYWGEAMTYHQSLWGRQSRNAAREALRRLGRTPAERAAKAPTQREKDYLDAVEALFGETEATRELPKYERDILYRDAMRRMHETYPDDLEATAFYGLSILTVGSVKRDYPVFMQAAAVLTEVWDANRMHPGGAHYLIHSYDDPVHAVLGLPMARAYSKIAPSAAHAQHMVSHIFSALGMWDDLVGANETAAGLEFDILGGKEDRTRPASHYVYWLQYGYLQQGRQAPAEALMRTARERLEANPMPNEIAYYGAMFARYLIDTEDWESGAEWAAPEGVEIPGAHYAFSRAVAAIKLGDLKTAREHAGGLQAGGGGNPEVALDEGVVDVLRKELEALFALAEGDGAGAVTLSRESVEAELALPFHYGPPRVVKPSAELLGDVLSELGENDEAINAYQDQLTRTPRRTNSLLGLARAATAAGDGATSTEAYRQLKTIWHEADPMLPALGEVKDSAQGTGEEIGG